VGYKIHSATREGERNAKDGGKDSPRAKLGHRPREDQSDYSRGETPGKQKLTILDQTPGWTGLMKMLLKVYEKVGKT
jgi:hypothetical protein